MSDLYVCSGCRTPIARNEPAKLYSEPGRYWYFHNNDQCFPRWKRDRLLVEVASLNRLLHEDPNERLHNGG